MSDFRERVAPRVYGSPAAPPALDYRRTLALLAAGPSALLSHRCAARVHGFDRFVSDVVEVTVPRCGRGVRLPFIVHTTDDLARLDRVMVGGPPVHAGDAHDHRPPPTAAAQPAGGGDRQRGANGTLGSTGHQ